MIFTEEEWHPIPGFSDYEVSSHGRIRSYKPWRGLPVPRIRSQYTNQKGYLAVQLTNDAGDTVTCRVHRLVLTAFAGEQPDDHEACHNNGIKTDNRLVNLRWDTRDANRQDAYRHGTHPGVNRLTHCRRGHEYTAENTRESWRKDPRNPNRKRFERVCLTCQHIRSQKFHAKETA